VKKNFTCFYLPNDISFYPFVTRRSVDAHKPVADMGMVKKKKKESSIFEFARLAPHVIFFKKFLN